MNPWPTLFAVNNSDQQIGSLVGLGLIAWGFVALRRGFGNWQVRRAVRAADQAQQAYFGEQAPCPPIEGFTSLSQRRRAGDDLDSLPERIHARLDPRLRKFLGGQQEHERGA